MEKTKTTEHVHIPLDSHDITEDDHAIVADFYKDACHAEWCEVDQELLLYVAARSRLNGAAAAFGVMGMFEAIKGREPMTQIAYKMFDIAKAAIELAHSGYDGPFMGDAVEPIFKAIRELEQTTQNASVQADRTRRTT